MPLYHVTLKAEFDWPATSEEEAVQIAAEHMRHTAIFTASVYELPESDSNVAK